MQPPGSPNPFGLNGPSVFAKRKRNLFKGPMLAFGGGSSSRSGNSGSHSRSASASGLGRRSGEITIAEEDEEAAEDYVGAMRSSGAFKEGEEEVEEVESFSPIIRGPGEQVEEIYEDPGSPTRVGPMNESVPGSSPGKAVAH